MQANKLSTYNTDIPTIEKQIETINGRTLIKTVAVKKVLPVMVTKRCNSPRVNPNFDFAGLAG
jgi:hypothetical protein